MFDAGLYRMRFVANIAQLFVWSLLALGTANAVAQPHWSDDATATLADLRVDSWTAEQGLPATEITAIRKTGTGHLWLGSPDGLIRFDGSSFHTFERPSSLASEPITALHEDGAGNLWIGTANAGLALHSAGEFSVFTTVDGLSSDHVTAIAEDGEGSFWIGSADAGITLLRKGNIVRIGVEQGLPGNRITALHAHEDGSVWIGVAGGTIARYSDGKVEVLDARFGVPGYNVAAFHQQASGEMWIGTRGGGLLRYSLGAFERFMVKDGLPSDHVLSLASDASGQLWIGTDRGGLARYDGLAFHTLTMADGLTHDVISSLFADDEGGLWVGTAGGGLNRIRKSAANRRGFAVDPKPRVGADSAPAVVLERVVADERAVLLDDPIVIPAGVGRIQFHYVGVTILAHDRLEYRYRLEGVDEDWIYAGSRRQASYTNLEPGRYTFIVESSDLDGGWSGLPIKAEIDVRPFFYETPFFQLLGLIAAAFLILAAYRWRVQHLKAREEELLELIDLHTKHLREEKEKTERALTETDRARREAEHQKEIAQRARAVIEEQAEQLREVDRIKTRFFNNVSHEFRTPLTLTIGPLENMLAGVYGPLDDQAQKQLDLALRNARRLLRLINQLLDLSKLESGKMDLTVSRGDVVPLVEGVMMSFTAFAEKKNLGLTFTSARSEVNLYFDPACLEKVLFNLLSNAVKFTEDGGHVRVSIDDGTTLVGGRRHDAVLVRVKDTGIGIPEEQLPHIFDRFHQVDGAVANAYEGTGIGLSLVTELVELHHGTITVHSEPGVGSEFIVALPMGLAHFSEDVLVDDRNGGRMPDVSRGPMMEMAVLGDDDDDDLWSESFGEFKPVHGDGGPWSRNAESEQYASVSTSGRTPSGETLESAATGNVPFSVDNTAAYVRALLSADQDPSSRGGHPTGPDEPDVEAGALDHAESPPAAAGGPRILIVDDNPDVVEYVANALCDEFTVIPAGNGNEALELARRRHPHLIISDVMMPGMDGYALCRQLKADDGLRNIPVILLTARAAQDDRIEGLEAGSDDYMSKPFSTRELKARVRNLLTVRDQQMQLSHLNSELAEKNDALREASEMKTQLLNIAAHDMKNPLNAIREFAQILKREIGEQSDHYDPLDLIHKSSDQMLNLVSTLLDSSALETGQITLNKEPIDVNSLAASVIRRNRKLAEKKNQTIELSVSADRCLVSGDKSRILEAMDNLVNNAVKYSPHRCPIRVAVERNATSVQFSVKDEGPGLSEEDKSKLFGKFQRLSAQPTGGETSTGLGLAIVKQIVEMHDGSILVESRQGSGTTFTIDLPILANREDQVDARN